MYLKPAILNKKKKLKLIFLADRGQSASYFYVLPDPIRWTICKLNLDGHTFLITAVIRIRIRKKSAESMEKITLKSRKITRITRFQK